MYQPKNNEFQLQLVQLSLAIRVNSQDLTWCTKSDKKVIDKRRTTVTNWFRVDHLPGFASLESWYLPDMLQND